MKFNILLAALLLTLFISCGEDEIERDRKIIEDYLTANNLEADSTQDGIYYIIDEPGSEEHPNINSTVTAKYVGYYTDNFIFDQSSTGVPFALSGVIRGWQIGIPLFGKGGKGKLLIPAVYGYGDNPPGTIREDAVLIFDVEIVDFN